MNLILEYSGKTIYKKITYNDVDFIPRKGDTVWFSEMSMNMVVDKISVDYVLKDGKNKAEITAILKL